GSRDTLSRCFPPPYPPPYDGGGRSLSFISSPVIRGRGGRGQATQRVSLVTGHQSENSFPASAQFSFLMSVMMICTASGVQPSARQVPSVSSFASFRRCSVVRPSNIWTLIIGIAVSPFVS